MQNVRAHLFIYGDDDALEQGTYERKLHREIQIFTAKTKSDLKTFVCMPKINNNYI